MVAPVGEGVGGIISQTNELVERLRGSTEIDLRVIDSTQRYRQCHDLRFFRRAWGGTWQGARILAQLVASCLTFRPSVVHLASSASLGLIRDIVLIAVVRLLNARVQLRLHFGRVPELAVQRNWEWRLLSGVCQSASAVLVLDSRSQAVLAATFPEGQFEVIPNAVGLASIDAIVGPAALGRCHPGVPRIVFVGMVLPQKGVVELVDACSRIRNPACELEIVGPVGPAMQERLQAIARERDDGRWLKFAGSLPRPEAIRRIAVADIFVLPSHSEGFPISLLEAMACSVAIVATNVGAIPEALDGTDGEAAGVVVPPRDTEALRAALEELLKNPTRRHALGVAARKKCDASYEFSALVSRLSALWRQTDAACRVPPTDSGVCLKAPAERS